MLKNKFIVSLILLLVSVQLVSADAAGEFQVEKDKNGVKVFTRKIEG